MNKILELSKRDLSKVPKHPSTWIIISILIIILIISREMLSGYIENEELTNDEFKFTSESNLNFQIVDPPIVPLYFGSFIELQEGNLGPLGLIPDGMFWHGNFYTDITYENESTKFKWHDMKDSILAHLFLKPKGRVELYSDASITMYNWIDINTEYWLQFSLDISYNNSGHPEVNLYRSENIERVNSEKQYVSTTINDIIFSKRIIDNGHALRLRISGGFKESKVKFPSPGDRIIRPSMLASNGDHCSFIDMKLNPITIKEILNDSNTKDNKFLIKLDTFHALGNITNIKIRLLNRDRSLEIDNVVKEYYENPKNHIIEDFILDFSSIAKKISQNNEILSNNYILEIIVTENKFHNGENISYKFEKIINLDVDFKDQDTFNKKVLRSIEKIFDAIFQPAIIALMVTIPTIIYQLIKLNSKKKNDNYK